MGLVLWSLVTGMSLQQLIHLYSYTRPAHAHFTSTLKELTRPQACLSSWWLLVKGESLFLEVWLLIGSPCHHGYPHIFSHKGKTNWIQQIKIYQFIKNPRVGQEIQWICDGCPEETYTWVWRMDKTQIHYILV